MIKILIFISILLFFLCGDKEKFMLWNNATRLPRGSYDIRNDPNLVYTLSNNGSLESIGYLFSPYVYTPSGKLIKLPNKSRAILF
jgi:hypothetical protein